MILPPLLVLRHGETEWNKAGRMQGRMDSPLTARGRSQAADQGALLRAFGVTGWAWRVSPQGRARHTAEIAAEGLDVVLTKDARLAEIDLGAWTGWFRGDIAATHPTLFEVTAPPMAWYDHAPGGEGIAALADRTKAFLRDLCAPTIIIGHGITGRVLRCQAMGLDPMAYGTLRGGQGVVHHIAERHETRLGEGA